MKKLTIKIRKINLTFIFLCLFPILPYYFRIFSVEASTIVAVVFIIGYMLKRLGRGDFLVSLKCDACELQILLWALIRSFQYISESQFIGALNIFVRTVLVGFILIEIINNKEKFLRAIDCIIGAGSIVAIFGLIEATMHFNVFELLNNTGETLNYNALRFGIRRILSFSSHTIVYCVYLMFILALVSYRITVSDKRRRKILWISYAVLFVNAVLTLSRSALLVLVLSQILIMYKCGLQRFLRKLGMIIIVVAGVVFVSSLFNGKVYQLVSNVILMLASVFNSDLQSSISSSFGSDNLNAIGTRLDLYGWVWNDVKNCLIFGKGSNAQFSHTMYVGAYSSAYEKTSIEVQWLNVLFHFGLTGLISELLVWVGLISTAIKGKRYKQPWEKQIGFGDLSLIALLCYFIQMFAVNQSSESKIFYIFCMLMITYKKHRGFESEVLKQ